MAIGGGEAGKYIINVTCDEISCYELLDRSQTEQTERLVVGIQLGNYTAKFCVYLQIY